jgi:hypothetical protein
MRVLIIAALLAAAPAVPAIAQSSDRAAFERCGTIADPAQRLACFDAALRETDADRQRRAAEQRAAEERAKREQFGLSEQAVEQQQAQREPERPPPVRVEAVEAQVSRATVDGLGRWTIEMSDGAVWRQTETIPTFQPPRRGDTVNVRKGILGAFLLQVGSQPFTRVVRVR